MKPIYEPRGKGIVISVVSSRSAPHRMILNSRNLLGACVAKRKSSRMRERRMPDENREAN